MLVAGSALFVALGGSAVAATHLIQTKDIAPDAVTSAKIKNGSVTLADLQAKTRTSLGSGTNGATGAAGTNGLSGTNGANGANGPNGANGAKGLDGTNGTNGTNGADGVLGPLASTGGLTLLPTAVPATTVVSLTVPAGNYAVFAKTQVSQTGAGDTVDCLLKAGTTTIDEASMKTLPALAATPMSVQAVTTTSPTQLSLQCSVAVANGTANFSSLIALPVN
jgi:hypothetical protein